MSHHKTMLACAGVLSIVAGIPVFAHAQNTTQADTTITVHGRVLNSITKEPVPRALVTSPGNEYAVMADDRGQFELKIPQQGPSQGFGNGTIANDAMMRTFVMQLRNFQARKPGFLPDHLTPSRLTAQNEVTIYLTPESLIVGHVTVPGSEGEIRIQCQLYKRGMKDGQETWSPSTSFTSWSDGEIRFSDLSAGTYKLITHEQIDAQSLMPSPAARMFGFPPVYYPNTTDFSLAAPIVVHAGETMQANLTVARQQYYPVRIPVRNAAPGPQPISVTVYPMAHQGPGWSLGYNSMEQAIVGMLPDGTYTVEAHSMHQPSSTGVATISVKGAPLDGTSLNLVPNATLMVNIREETSSVPAEAQQRVPGPNGFIVSGAGRSFVQVMLTPVEQLNSNRGLIAHPADAQDQHSQIIDNVPPGRYHVNVTAGATYAAAIDSGGRDLLKQPLLLGVGAAVPPIEITLRNDGGEVSGTVAETGEEEASSSSGPNHPDRPTRYIYLLPTQEGMARMMQTNTGGDSAFRVAQVPPGDYLAVAFEQVQQDLPYGNEEALEGWETKGQKIHVEAGQKMSVKLNVIAGSDLP